MYKVKPVKSFFCIVNVYDEFIFNENGIMIFETELDAQTFCDRINVCSDGGIITNFI